MSLRNQTSIHIGRAPPLNRETPQITTNRGQSSRWVAGRRDWLDEIQAQLDKDFKCELEAMALAPPRERGKGKLSFQNLSHFVEEAIVARDWLE